MSTRDPRLTGSGDAAFYRDVHQAPMSAWVAISLMFVGMGCVGAAVCYLRLDQLISWYLFAIGGALGLAGIGTAMAGKIMSHTTS